MPAAHSINRQLIRAATNVAWLEPGRRVNPAILLPASCSGGSMIRLLANCREGDATEQKRKCLRAP